MSTKSGEVQNRIIDKLECFGESANEKNFYIKEIRELAIRIVKETLTEKLGGANITLSVEEIETLINQIERANIIPEIEYKNKPFFSLNTAVYAFMNRYPEYKDNIYYTKNLISTPLRQAAGLIIHEGIHHLGYGQFGYPKPREECEIEMMAVEIVDHSISSGGLLPSGYLFKDEGFLSCYKKKHVCGAPIVLKTKNLYNNAEIILRSNNWVGGKSICDKVFIYDVNRELQIPLISKEYTQGRITLNRGKWPIALKDEYDKTNEFISIKFHDIN